MTAPSGDATASVSTAEAVARQLLPQDADQADIDAMAARVADHAAAVDELVVSWKGPEPTSGWGAQVRIGKAMLGARLWRRRDSPGGVEAFGADGVAYVVRIDPDVAMLLGIGPWSPPVVG